MQKQEPLVDEPCARYLYGAPSQGRLVLRQPSSTEHRIASGVPRTHYTTPQTTPMVTNLSLAFIEAQGVCSCARFLNKVPNHRRLAFSPHSIRC